jgi:hypothetical protein
MTTSCALDQLTLAPLTPCKAVQVRSKKIVLLTFSDAVFKHVNKYTEVLFKFQTELHTYRLQQCQYTHTKPVGGMVTWNRSLEMPSKSSGELFLQWVDNVSQSVVWGPTWETDSCAITAFPRQITNVALPSLLWHATLPGRLYAPAAIYPQGNSLLLISVRGWVDTTDTECEQKEQVTWKLPKDPAGNWTQNLQRCSTSRNSATLSPRMGSTHYSNLADPSFKFSPADPR